MMSHVCNSLLPCLRNKVFYLPSRQRVRLGKRELQHIRHRSQVPEVGAFRGPDYVDSAYTRAFIQYTSYILRARKHLTGTDVRVRE